jgi:mannose-6-phosphate isomerase-like protein (cupin superfamily)
MAADYTAKRIDEMDAGFGGAFKRVRAELGVQSFGVQIIDLPPNIDQYPEHDHAEAGQEEVFWVVRGSGWIEIDGERVDLDPERIVRVGPAARRKLYSGPEGARILALGGVPGQVYEPPAPSQIGAPDPVARSAS